MHSVFGFVVGKAYFSFYKSNIGIFFIRIVVYVEAGTQYVNVSVPCVHNKRFMFIMSHFQISFSFDEHLSDGIFFSKNRRVFNLGFRIQIDVCSVLKYELILSSFGYIQGMIQIRFDFFEWSDFDFYEKLKNGNKFINPKEC